MRMDEMKFEGVRKKTEKARNEILTNNERKKDRKRWKTVKQIERRERRFQIC